MYRLFFIALLMSLTFNTSIFGQEMADMVLENGKIITMNAQKPRAEALAIKGDRILAVGTNAEMKKLSGDATRVIDLKGATAIPGFIEGHAHLSSIGTAIMNLDLMASKNWQHIIDMVKAETAKKKPGEWIVGRGWHQEKWDKQESVLVEGFPVHDRLSAISPDHPVLLVHASGHASFGNAKAMELAGVTAQSKDPNGGTIMRNAKGEPTGIFVETAMSLVGKAYQDYQNSLSPEARKAQTRKAIQMAISECLSKGITSFHDAGSDFGLIDILKEMADQKALGMRLWIMASGSNEELDARLPQYKLKDYGGGFLTVGGIKKYVDGALGSRGAWLLEPYTDQPDTSGLNVTTMEELHKTAEIAQKHDFQLCTHAIGDRGNREVLDIYEKYMNGQDLRWRIEHAQHLNPADIPRFASLKVIASMQGVHCTSDAPFVVKRLGDKRASEGAYVWKALLDAGAVVTNGTDAPVEDVSALASYYAMVTRKPKTMPPFYPQHKLTPMEALACYTTNNAYAVFEEDRKGRLAPGMYADITVLSDDITAIDPEKIKKTRVKYTIVGGNVAYRHR